MTTDEIEWNDGETFIRRRWRQKNSEAHNGVLRTFRHKHGEDTEIDNIETTVEELFMPDTDPLEDLEGFVHRW